MCLILQKSVKMSVHKLLSAAQAWNSSRWMKFQEKTNTVNSFYTWMFYAYIESRFGMCMP